MIQPRHERPNEKGYWLFWPEGGAEIPSIVKIYAVARRNLQNGEMEVAPGEFMTDEATTRRLKGMWAGPIVYSPVPIDRLGWGHHHYDCKIVSDGRGKPLLFECVEDCPTGLGKVRTNSGKET